MTTTSTAEKFSIGIFSILTFIVGISVRGDSLLILSALFKQYSSLFHQAESIADDFNSTSTKINLVSDEFSVLNFKHILWHQCVALLMSFGGFFVFGGTLNHYYHVKQKQQASEWKCQPHKFLSAENERHAFKLGSMNMVFASALSGLASACLYENGPSKLYFTITEKGWLYFIASIPVYFLVIDGLVFYAHRFFHSKYFYGRFHSWHHRYHQPVVWTALALHPVEMLIVQSILILPMFLVEIHVVVFVGNLVYCYYYGMTAHSGVKMTSIWPWQPPSTFHDNHHVNPNCNIGFNTIIFDWFQGTLYENDDNPKEIGPTVTD
ncbi:uncharacterized protein LOC141903459 [Tubulanus polymorphus]|uniref:uncharacterized protein LOC141903459 n=1 Tax=Tubulanus polymorphus TaxID=672921 RepID=UPI003DA36287